MIISNRCYMFFMFITISSFCALSFAQGQAKLSWAQKTLASLTLREKIGQLFIVPTASCFDQPEEALATAMHKCPYKMDPEYVKQLITEYKVGGLIFLFKSTPDVQIDAINEYQKLSKTPLIIGQDCEWGLSMRLYNTLRFPRNMTLGALQNKNLIYQMGQEVGRQCKVIGVHINFSPVVDVNNNRHNPVIHDRSFGEDPHKVAKAGLMMMQGLESSGIIACAKHFPGHGDTSVDSHVDLPLIPHTKERLRKVEFVPFKHLIDHGARAVMSAHLAIPALEKEEQRASSLSRAITTQLLENELGFKGLKITDGIGMEALTKHYMPGHIELEAFLAGNEILLCPLDVPIAMDLIEQAIRNGKVTKEDLDKRVLKILEAKEWAGCHTFKPINKEHALGQLITPQAQKLKAQLYQEAITLLPNKREFVPITDTQAIAVVQIGGDINSTFKQHIKQQVPCSYYHVTRDAKTIDTLTEQLNTVQTIIIPLFEMNKFSAQNYGISDTTKEFLNQLQRTNKRIIVVPFGTPYSVGFFNAVDTVIIAYEDDPDAQKAAVNVLIGRNVASGTPPVTIS